MSVTTCKVVACQHCGRCFGVEGYYAASPPHCPESPTGDHKIVFVLVVVPLW